MRRRGRRSWTPPGRSRASRAWPQLTLREVAAAGRHASPSLYSALRLQERHLRRDVRRRRGRSACAETTAPPADARPSAAGSAAASTHARSSTSRSRDLGAPPADEPAHDPGLRAEPRGLRTGGGDAASASASSWPATASRGRRTSTCTSRWSAAWSTPSSPTTRAATAGAACSTGLSTCSPTTWAWPPDNSPRNHHDRPDLTTGRTHRA